MLYETTLRTKRTPLCASYICRAYCNNYYCIAARVCLMTRENCRVNRTGVCGFFFCRCAINIAVVVRCRMKQFCKRLARSVRKKRIGKKKFLV